VNTRGSSRLIATDHGEWTEEALSELDKKTVAKTMGASLPREGRSARRRLEPHPRDRRVQSRRSERERRLEGAGDVELSGHELATVAALPIREVVLAIHVIADLSLGEAEVAHHHLANRQSTDRQSTGKVRRSG
jgi:hypothetical protein